MKFKVYGIKHRGKESWMLTLKGRPAYFQRRPHYFTRFKPDAVAMLPMLFDDNFMVVSAEVDDEEHICGHRKAYSQ